MKIKNSVSFKLFIITTTIFLILFSVIFIFQNLFFSKIYTSKKENDIVKQVTDFKAVASSTNDYMQVIEAMKDYEEKYNTLIGEVDYTGQLTMYRTAIFKIDNDRAKIFKDVISEVQNNVELNNEIVERDTVTFTTNELQYNVKSIVCITKDANKLIIGVTSMQPIDEALNVIESIYKYFYILIIIVIIIVTFVAAMLISKPLIKINETAKRMAQLDFSEKCDEDRLDEIGGLAKTLNFLSSSLSSALGSLRLANEKLKEDIEKERALESMRKEFVATVSHELKTPISLIKGYAEGIKDGILEDQDYSLNVIIDESDKMSNLVKDMLDLSQLEAGMFKLNFINFNILELTKTVAKKLQYLAEEKSVNISINSEYDDEVNADINRIEQVVTNFLTNSIRHCENNKDVVIRLRKSKNHNVRIEIENTGEKIFDEDIGKIWDKFYKIDKSRNRSVGGTGLGLSIVKNIIVLHNGEYGVENTENGVKFYFEI
ncbi:MAG: ATP-binding protein [Clostridiaceae bacterium]